MQVTDLTSQLEAARNAVVHLHTRLTTATKLQQADASQQNRRVQQLEVEQAALNSKLDSLTITLNSSQHKNASAICDMRSTMNTFLDKLISTIVQQLGKLQAELAESQADGVKAAVQNAVGEVCSTAAGSSLLERLVHQAVADLVKQELRHQISEEVGNGALTSQDGILHNDKAKSIHNDSRSQAAHLPDTCGQAVYSTQKQASADGLCKPADNQAVAKGSLQASSPIPAGKPPVARSQDSLSLMHHASTAGSWTLTPPKSHSARWRSSGQSPTDNRQALVEIDLNQEPKQAGFQTATVSHLTGQQTHQHAELKGQEQRLHHEPTPQQQPSMQHKGSKGSRQSKQLRWADTARQLNQQLLQGSRQPADSSQSAASSGNAAAITADPGSNRVSEQGCHGAAITDQDQSTHLEQLCAPAQSPENSRIARLQHLPNLAYPMMTVGVTPRASWQAPHSYDPQQDVNTAESRPQSGHRLSGFRQYASEGRGHMQPPQSVTGRADANYHASECQQHAVQQTFVAESDSSLAVTSSMHRQPGVHTVEGSDVPAGIPLTPEPGQQPQPRDSLEASIWKLSGGRWQHAKMCLP